MKLMFSKFLKGLLYFFTLPIMVVLLSVVSVIGLIYFIALGIKAIILFFQGKSLFKDLPEDIEVRKIKRSQIPQTQDKKDETNNDPMMIYTTQNIYNYDNFENTQEEDSEPIQQEIKELEPVSSESLEPEPEIKSAVKSDRITLIKEDKD